MQGVRSLPAPVRECGHVTDIKARGWSFLSIGANEHGSDLDSNAKSADRIPSTRTAAVPCLASTTGAATSLIMRRSSRIFPTVNPRTTP